VSDKDILAWMENWYSSQCDGAWEHDCGIEIGTLDNPGWSLKVDLAGTPKESAPPSETKIERSETDWIHYYVREGRFEAFGGAKNLQEMLGVFQDWMLKG
jgi:hypothetical protein